MRIIAYAIYAGVAPPEFRDQVVPRLVALQLSAGSRASAIPPDALGVDSAMQTQVGCC